MLQSSIHKVLEGRVVQSGCLELRYQARNPLVGLCLGDNATGKSLLRKLLQSVLRTQGVSTIHLSMEGRTSTFSPIRSVIYGSEQDESTGVCSVNLIRGLARQTRTEPFFVILDEPDTGLSDRWVQSVGRELTKYLSSPPEMFRGMLITTHRVVLVRELEPLNPSGVLVGPEWPLTIEHWLEGDPREPEPIENLSLRGKEMWRRVERLKK